jgi:predicted TIM-barrel fold metal-dependent hydrolase
MSAPTPHIASLADIDGHIIEPGDLWVTRLPEELRAMAPEFFRDAEGRFHQRIYGIDIEQLDVMYGGMRPKDMLASMGLACAMGVDLGRVLSAGERERHTILDGPPWAIDGRQRLDFNRRHGLSRALLFPTFMLAGGSFLPNVAPAVCRVYNDWMLDEYCAGAGNQMLPAAALPVTDVAASAAEVHRVAEKGCRCVFVRTNAIHGTKLSDPSFDPMWQAIVDTGVKLGLHPLPMWDQDGTSRGYKLTDIMGASALGFPMDMIFTVYDLMAGGVFDRFPTMQTMILEAGAGWIPSMFERWEEHQKLFGRIQAPQWKSEPMEIFDRQMMVAVEACETTDIKIALDFLPADHVAVASDWPHYDGTPELLSGFRKVVADLQLSEADAQNLATGTFERWFPA